MDEGLHAMIDCYVRLGEAALLKLPLTHLESGVDTDDDFDTEPERHVAEGRSPGVRGFTEWVTTSDPVVSVGWDWCLVGLATPVLDVHSVRTNVMLIDARQVDCGQEATVAAVIQLINRQAWQDVVLYTLRHGVTH